MTRKHNLTSAARKEQTVQAVIELCGQEEPATLTTNDIAKKMGVTQGALFRHFSSKNSIWEAVVKWVAKRLMQRLDAAVAQASSPSAALGAMFMAHMDFIVEHPGVPRLLLGQLQKAKPTPAQRMVNTLLFLYRQRVEQLLMEGVEAGQLRAELNIEAAATQYIGMVQGLVIQSLLKRDVPVIIDQAPAVFELYCRGISKTENES
ncbi:MAG: TetR family transcriptional regulator [Porticoccus sp.]|jgi:AcrR family transcriptional regulator|uniref:TetR/AcrR family transcriptional regulator n=1 Tax=Porticoccus hydrocarbonoclasticus TaxID=1073414 RepID=UPI000C4BC5F1|nr:TetR/AcrR family transcriptional regulator [Porticoccus hydrocarbonoclasticus]MBG58063.1 TetR family transcriptional regulator [Porticoccus sp.]|tara:strand:- start:3313 stop:3927 length:615 start_codon:yes stop_codon:yes gene_type:complete